MSENLSRRGILQLGGCVPFAGAALSMASPAVACRSDVEALWDAFNAIRNEGDRLYKIWCEACDRASDKSPDLPEGLAFPNPQFRPWLQFEREGMIGAVKKGKIGEPRGRYYRPEILADFLADPPEICGSIDDERVPRVIGLIRELLPVAESYTAAVEEAWREADEIHDASAFEELFDHRWEAAEALMNAPVADARDFIFKAMLIRVRLDEELDVEPDSQKLVDQMISFWGAGGNV